MEEDILYEFRNIVEESRIEDNRDYYIKLRDTLDFMENLLTRYKELEKENEKLNQLKEKHNVRINDLCALVDNFAYNSIPVSLVEEKIEEINKAYEDSKDENGESQYYYPDYTIRVLEELLEKRK